MLWLIFIVAIALFILMDIATTTTLAEFIEEEMGRALLAVRAQVLFFPGGPAHQFVRVRDLTNQGGDAADFNKYNELEAHDVVEGEDFTETQDLDPTSTNIPSTEKQVITWLTDRAARSLVTPNDYRAYAADVAAEHMAAHAAKLDADMFAAFTGLTLGHSGTGAAITNAHIKAAVKIVREADAPKPWVGFLHTEHYGDLSTEASSPFLSIAESGPNLAGEMYAEYELRRAYGVTWFITTSVYDDGTDVWGGIICPRSLGMVLKKLPTMSLEYDQSRRATEVSSVADYGVGVADAAMGWYLRSDAP